MSAQPSQDDFNRDANRSPAGAYSRSRLEGPIDGGEVAMAQLQAELSHTLALMAELNAERARQGKLPLEMPSQRKADEADPVNKPAHYRSHASGVECITITEHFNFCIGNAIKYLWRGADNLKGEGLQDLEKASWYINREIERRKKEAA